MYIYTHTQTSDGGPESPGVIKLDTKKKLYKKKKKL